MTKKNTLIRFSSATLGYGGDAVLENVDCDIAEGDYVGLVGPNGSGKTTFLKAVLGELRPSGGTVETNRRRRFAYVPQAEEINLIWPLSVREVVSLALRSRRLFGRLKAEEERAVEVVMARAGIADIADRRISDVSGGQRQRAILAQALAQSPDVLLLDEPTRGLDVVVERDFLAMVADIRRAGSLTILLVTHTLHIPLNVCDRVLLFRNRRTVQASPEELVRTDRLGEVYGVPFIHGESDGYRWTAPRNER